jgi:hypothetical protein
MNSAGQYGAVYAGEVLFKILEKCIGRAHTVIWYAVYVGQRYEQARTTKNDVVYRACSALVSLVTIGNQRNWPFAAVLMRSVTRGLGIGHSSDPSKALTAQHT